MPEVVQSARWVAAQRLRESERTDRLFSDPLAPALSGDEGMAALKLSEKYNPRHEETANYIAIRTRFFDDVAQADATAGTRQIVLPAAGMDARAYRISWLGTTLYEIDHPHVLAAKEEILQAQHRALECKRITIGADLTQDWIHGLVDSGFQSNERSTWLIEGLFYYLDEPAVNRILKDSFSSCRARQRARYGPCEPILAHFSVDAAGAQGDGRTGDGLAVWHGRPCRALRCAWLGCCHERPWGRRREI